MRLYVGDRGGVGTLRGFLLNLESIFRLSCERDEVEDGLMESCTCRHHGPPGGTPPAGGGGSGITLSHDSITDHMIVIT